MDALVGRRAFDRIKAQVRSRDALLHGVIADFRPITQHRLQPAQALHLQQAAKGIVAVVQCQFVRVGQFQPLIDNGAVAALRDRANPCLIGVEESLQVKLAVHDKRRQGVLLAASDRDAIAGDHKRLAGKYDVPGPLGRPQQRWIAGERGLAQHLHAARAIDVHYLMAILRQVSDQYRQQLVQGALALMDRLAHWLKTLTGMPAVALSPKAGAHGELCGLMAIRAAHEASGQHEKRRKVLVPTSAHGTNPATAAFVGYSVVEVAQTDDGRVDVADLAAKLGPDVAAIMVTNPNTCGLFERDILEISRLTHEAGAYFYCDGANFNAIVGRVRPGDLGVDAMHINLHKTFSTPHGGGGPGAGAR